MKSIGSRLLMNSVQSYRWTVGGIYGRGKNIFYGFGKW